MPPSFELVRDRIANVDGWLTDAQARELYTAAGEVRPGGRIVEIGSFHGRSTIVLASGADDDVEIVAIDPHAGTDRGPHEWRGFEAEAESDNQRFNRNLREAGVAGRVRHVRAFSNEAHGEVGGAVELLWIDGAHRYAPALDDLRHWGDRVVPGGRMLVHDSWNSIGVTLALLRHLTFSRRWRYDGRVGSLARYTKTPSGWGSTVRQLVELPWFVLSQVRKLLTVLKLRKGDWPH